MPEKIIADRRRFLAPALAFSGKSPRVPIHCEGHYPLLLAQAVSYRRAVAISSG